MRPPRAVPYPTSRLPATLARGTSFIGRKQEVSALRALLLRDEVRLVTLVGPPGVGKTTLAKVSAAALAGEFADGLIVIDLSPVRDAALVPLTVAGALGVVGAGHRPAADAVAEYLGEAETLLLLDNLEQVIDAGPELATLVNRCPGIKILATSREPLHVDVEHQFPLRPLPVPRLNGPVTPAELARVPAAALFLDRARMVRPGFTLTEETARAVAEVCVRLDGLPLAIEMAAAQIKYLTPVAIVQALERSTGSLASQARNLPDRHRSLRACIAWSYGLLTPIQQGHLRTLGVFHGGFTAEAAMAVAGADSAPATPDALAALIDKGLVEMTSQSEGIPRMMLLETVREFALEELAAQGEEQASHRRHARYFLDLARRAEPRLHGAEQDLWAQRLESEQSNFRAAMEWALGGGEAELAADLAWALHWLWYFYGHNREGREWISRVVAAPSVPARARARALAAGGVLAWSVGEDPEAERWLAEAIALLRDIRDDAALALALHYFGHVLHDSQGRSAEAVPVFEESIALFRALGNEWGVAFSSNCSGLALGGIHEYARAVARMDEAHAAYQRLGNRRLLAWGQADLAEMLTAKGDLDAAIRISERAVAELRKSRTSVRLMWAVGRLADLTARQTDPLRALPLYKEYLFVANELGARPDIVIGLWGIGAAAAAMGMAETAAAVLGAADGQYRLLDRAGPATRRREAAERVAGELRRALGDVPFETAWRRGVTAELSQLIEEALGVEPDQRVETGPRADSGPLSPREREVAALIAQGLSNREIARTLLIGHRTVATHVQSVLNKLGVDRRSQIAAWAVSRGLHTPAP